MDTEQILYKTLGSEHLWVRVDVDKPEHIQQFLAIESDKTAVLFKNSSIHHSRWDASFFDAVVKEHISFGNRLAQSGVKKLALTTDDGILHQMLSPRFSSLDLADRAGPLCKIYSALKDKFDEVVVWLLVEELAPGGLDATDGVKIAQELATLGLSHVVACGGTKDFPPLYFRKSTQKKHEDEFISTEPALASALWLLNATKLKVSALAFIDDAAVAADLAQSLGIYSLIDKPRNQELL